MDFWALPVTRGDAFLLDWPGHTVLVDGGQSRDAVVGFLGVLHVAKVDVAVCTHKDQDHTEGIVGLLNSPIDVGELWVPALWAEVARQVTALTRDVKWTDPHLDVAKVTLPPDLREAWPEPSPWVLGSVPDGRTVDRQVPALTEGAGQKEDKPWTRITQMLETARKQGVRIRWFDSDLADDDWPGGGEPGWLQPVNAVEVTMQSVAKTPSLAAALDELNHNCLSLVLYAPSGLWPGPVLFTGDSHFDFIKKPWFSFVHPDLRGGLVTAQHHGSNDVTRKPYDTVTALAGDEVAWIRSNGKRKLQHDARFYLLTTKRYCTRCSQETAVMPIHAGWTSHGWRVDTPECHCEFDEWVPFMKDAHPV